MATFSNMESRNSKLLQLMNAITTRGKNFNDLKLEQLKIAEQPDISIEIDGEEASDTDRSAATSKPAPRATTTTKNVPPPNVIASNNQPPRTGNEPRKASNGPARVPSTHSSTASTINRGAKRTACSSTNEDRPFKKQNASKATAIEIEDLTQDVEPEQATKCSCKGSICERNCPCIKAGGVCNVECSCDAAIGCLLHTKVFARLFGHSTGVKITPCFANHLSKQAGHVEVGASSEQTFMRLIGDQQTYSKAQPEGSPNVERSKLATKPLFALDLEVLVNTLHLKVLGNQNEIASTFPFANTYSKEGDMALVAWYGKWKAARASITQARRSLRAELLRFALTKDAGSNCYYCFCSDQWETVTLWAHCDSCKACRSIHRSHCDKCKKCTLACAHPSR